MEEEKSREREEKEHYHPVQWWKRHTRRTSCEGWQFHPSKHKYYPARRCKHSIYPVSSFDRILRSALASTGETQRSHRSISRVRWSYCCCSIVSNPCPFHASLFIDPRETLHVLRSPKGQTERERENVNQTCLTTLCTINLTSIGEFFARKDRIRFFFLRLFIIFEP